MVTVNAIDYDSKGSADNIWVCAQDGGLLKSSDGGHSFDNFYWELPFESSAEHRSARAVGLYFEGNEGYCVYLCPGQWEISVLRCRHHDPRPQQTAFRALLHHRHRPKRTTLRE